MTDKLNTEIQALEDINGKVRRVRQEGKEPYSCLPSETTIQLEKLLQQFIAEVKKWRARQLHRKLRLHLLVLVRSRLGTTTSRIARHWH